MSLYLVGCNAPAPAAGCPTGVLIVTTDENLASGVGVLPLDGAAPQILYGNSLGGDPALASSRGRNFFLARDNGTIFELDSCGRAIAQFPSNAAGESGTDPWDVAVASDGTLWIARYEYTSALVLDAAGTILTTIDFSSFNAAGALYPDMSAVQILTTSMGEKAFFTLERLTPVPSGYSAEEPSAMVIVDTRSRAIEQSIMLAGNNPQAPTAQVVDDSGAIYLADAGNWGDVTETNAGVERFDTATLTTSLLFDKPALGGSPAMVAVAAGCGAAIVADATTVNRTSLVVFALDGSGTVVTALGPTPGFDLRGLLWVQGGLLVGDSQLTPEGFHVHQFVVGAGCALTATSDLIVPSLPPLAFAL